MESIHVILARVLARDTEDAAFEFLDSMRLMEDLGLTSVATLELLLELEDTLEIQIDVEEIQPTDLACIGALADFIASHAAAD